MTQIAPAPLPAPGSSLQVPDVSAQPEQIVAPQFELTESAVRAVRRALGRLAQTAQGAFLRVGVKGGGCSGMSYFMEPDTLFDERDVTWVVEDVRIVADRRSLEHISGMTIDYDIKNLMEGGFVYRNPNAGRSCGCGVSFTPK